MNVSKEKTGTLRAETHGHVPIIAAGFKGNQGTKARGIGYEKEKSPTLLAGQEPHVVMCFENHAQDARVRQVDVAPTLSAKAGMGGNNLPIVMESIPDKSFCIAGNTIERQIQNGGNGKGVLEEMSYTLNTTDRHAVAQPYGGVMKAYAIGNGQADQLKMSEKVGTLNCMHDQIAVMQECSHVVEDK